jgi:hypothetical protein
MITAYIDVIVQRFRMSDKQGKTPTKQNQIYSINYSRKSVDLLENLCYYLIDKTHVLTLIFTGQFFIQFTQRRP